MKFARLARKLRKLKRLEANKTKDDEHRQTPSGVELKNCRIYSGSWILLFVYRVKMDALAVLRQSFFYVRK